MTPVRLRLSLSPLTLILVNYKKTVLSLTTYLGITLPLLYLLGFGFHSRKYGYHLRRFGCDCSISNLSVLRSVLVNL